MCSSDLGLYNGADADADMDAVQYDSDGFAECAPSPADNSSTRSGGEAAEEQFHDVPESRSEQLFARANRLSPKVFPRINDDALKVRADRPGGDPSRRMVTVTVAGRRCSAPSCLSL